MLQIKALQPILRRYRSVLNITPVVHNKISKRYKSKENTTLTTKSESTQLDTNVKPIGEKIKETTKTASYLGIIIFGAAVTGTLFYAVFRELFSSNSPNNIYSKAAKKCINNTQVADKLGVPITAYGEEIGRRRRRVAHVAYMGKDGRKHLRMKFNLKGSVFTGTAQLDMVENDAGNYECRYLLVEVDDMLRNVIVVEDNRNTVNSLDTLSELNL